MSHPSSAQRVARDCLRRALRGGRIAVWDFDLAEGHLTWSDNTEEVLGCAPGEPSDFDRRVHPDDQERHQRALRQALSSGGEYDIELRFIKPDGEVIWLQDTGEVQIDPDNHRTFSGICIDITACKRTEVELRDSEERYRALALASASVVWRATPDGQLVSVAANDKHLSEAQITRYDDGGWLADVHPDDREEARIRWQATLASGEPSENTFRMLQASGEYRWMMVRAAPLKATDGPVREWVGTFTDIHEHKVALEQLARSEERLRLAMEVTGLGTYSVDLQRNEREWSASMRGLLGIGPDDPIGLDVFAARVHPDDFGWTYEMYSEHRGKGTPFTGEFRIIRADDGQIRWVSGFSGITFDREGKPVRIVGTLQDITARKEAELALRDSETRYRHLAETATDIIVRSDLTGRCLYLSRACRDILGYEPEELVGVHPRTIVHADDSLAVLSGLEALVSGTLEQDAVTYRLRHKQGHWVWVEANRRLIRADDGTPQEVVSIARDISERQRLEAQLRQAQKMEAIGQLTGGVAHDFNNLLTVILGNAEILTDELRDPHLRSMAGLIEGAAERGASLTQHLLAFARRQTLRPERLDVGEVVRELEPLLRRTLPENIHVVRDVQGQALVTMADRALLESAILNLVVNGKDAMPQGGTLTIQAGERLAGPGEGGFSVGQPVVFVTVQDSGTGMNLEVLSRVFDPFFTTKEVGKGSGLGLSMVYGFAQQSGGYAAAQSHENVGTSVSIVLPALGTSPEPGRRFASPREITGGTESILVVEDQQEVRAFLTTQLVGFGYRVKAVADGCEALQVLIEDKGFDLLFTDVMLPQGMSGVELAQQARKIKPNLRILLTSGYPQEVFEQQGQPDPGTNLLRKPFKRRELGEIVRKVLDEHPEDQARSAF